MTNQITGQKTIILIPSYQPGKSLVDFTKQLLEAGFEVLIVNDGSGEYYQNIFNNIDKRVSILNHPYNRGKGEALKTGYRYIRNNFNDYIIVTADSDGQHNVTDIKKIVRSCPDNPSALILGAREFIGGNIPFKSKFGNILTRKIFSAITGRQLRDTQTGLRAFDQSLINFMIDIPGERFEYEMNVLLACSKEKINMVELPIQTIYNNNNEGSHFNPIKDSWAIYKEVFKFASSSILSFAIDYLIFVIIVQLTSSWELATSVIVANIIARVISASFNFTVNKRLVFRDNGRVVNKALSYIVLASSILIANTLLITLLTNTLGIVPYIAKIMTEIILFFISYFVQKNIIFNEEYGVRI